MRKASRPSTSPSAIAVKRSGTGAGPAAPVARQPWLPRALPFALFIAALALRGLLEAPLEAAGFATHWLYALQVLVAGVALVFFWRGYTELARPPALSAVLLSVGAGAIVFVLWITLTQPWMRIGEPVASFVPVDADGALLWPQILLRATGAALVVPLIEELFWRSLLMRWLDRRDFLSVSPRHVSLYALVLSSAVFALEHDLWLAGIVAGLVYGLVYMRTANLWNAVIAHAVTNLMLAAWVVQQRRWEFW